MESRRLPIKRLQRRVGGANKCVGGEYTTTITLTPANTRMMTVFKLGGKGEPLLATLCSGSATRIQEEPDEKFVRGAGERATHTLF